MVVAPGLPETDPEVAEPAMDEGSGLADGDADPDPEPDAGDSDGPPADDGL